MENEVKPVKIVLGAVIALIVVVLLASSLDIIDIRL